MLLNYYSTVVGIGGRSMKQAPVYCVTLPTGVAGAQATNNNGRQQHGSLASSSVWINVIEPTYSAIVVIILYKAMS